jgi:hypothetical protein
MLWYVQSELFWGPRAKNRQVSKLNANRQPGEAFGAAMGRIYKDIGFMGLWNGLPVRIVMIGTVRFPRSPFMSFPLRTASSSKMCRASPESFELSFKKDELTISNS